MSDEKPLPETTPLAETSELPTATRPTVPIDDPTPTFPADTTPSSTFAATTPNATFAATPSPRIRWGGVVWGALFCAFGVVVMVVLSTASNRDGFTSWVNGLGPGGAGIVGIVALGVLLVILGIVGAANRAQRAR